MTVKLEGSDANIGYVSERPITALDAKTLNVTTVKALADFNFADEDVAAATYALIATFTNGANFLTSGDEPTATFGIPLQAGGPPIGFPNNADILALQVVSQTGTASITLVLYGDA